MVELSGDEITKSNNHKLDLSNKRFKEVSNSDYKKFEMLPNWLNNVSYRYEEETKKHFPNKYYHYKRGTIIRVDFGVNMGSEFSFPHFAIVLDKHDNSNSRTLTVIPLTSKQKSGRFPLGKEIFNQTLTIMRNRIIENKKDIDRNISELNKSVPLRVSLLNELLDVFSQSCPQYESEINILKIKDDTITLEEFSDLSLKINQFMSDKEDFKITDNLILEKISLINSNFDIVQKRTKQAHQDLNDMKKIIDIYSEYNKDSYARLTDITTISKFRIKRINRFDPSGKIRLNSQQMKDISNELMTLFISR
ncbi:type II toxin-antitoxin system PemK/MazF family toxin [Companilactobacillus musae]|uniref:type II toxin-antitoxin system PemK/MazF family toxin n=1 Tax=Companilactobacillus musae TaxID=1903258 RepID=UPI000E659B79|nr:type II toxin-antitoxin system PemK/MazF family toxin [Companilactobacillus musae]